MTYKRPDIAVQVNIKSIKGYTMKEIGALDDRIRRLEYYTVLNALALDTKTLSIRSPDGKYERLKNGIFADPFNDHSLGRIEDPEYRIAVDSTKSIARPAYSETYNGFVTNETGGGYTIKGRIALLDYDHEKITANPFATTYRNCTESYYSFKGNLQLFPNYDNYTNLNLAAPQVMDIDLAQGFKDLLSGNKLKTQDIASVSHSPVLTDKQGRTNYWSQTTTTTITDIAVNTTTIRNDLGDLVTDVSNLPYMRGRMISVIATGMKPNTRIYAYFDKVNVSQYCYPAVLNPVYADINGNLDPNTLNNLNAGYEDNVLLQSGGAISTTASPTSTLFTDDKGRAFLKFRLPDNTFRTGDRALLLTNVDDLNAVGAIITTATGTYTASSLSVTKKNVSFNVVQPSFTPSVVSSNSVSNYTTEDPPPPPPYYGGGGGGGNDRDPREPTWWGNDRNDPWAGSYGYADSDWGSDSWGGDGDGCGDDPVAETFQINTTTNANVPGFFLTGIGVYFKSKSSTLGATMHVCETVAGIPNASKQIAIGRLNSADITISNDSSAETIFYFDTPALIQSNLDYAFYIIPDGSNPDYEIWISEVGGADIISGRAITQQPYPGVMYVSSNGRSWNSVQSTDLKFNIYRASFNYGNARLVFRNEPNDFITLNNLLRANTSTAIQMGDVVYAANTSNTNQIFSNTQIYPYGVITNIDELNQKLIIRSNGLFNSTTYPYIKIFRITQAGNTQQLISNNLIATSNVVSIDDIYYHGVVPKFTTNEPAGTSTLLTYYGTSNSTYSYAYDNTSTAVFKESLYLFNDYERVVRSYSNEIAAGTYGANGTSTVVVGMTTNHKYLSPVVDLATKSTNYIKNLISSNNYNESTRYGGALNKYISKPVDMNIEAEDILVYITGYRPAGTDIQVYGKFKNKNDNANFDDIPWTRMYLSNIQTSQFNSPKDVNDYSEYVYYVSTGNTVPTQNTAYLDPTTSPANILSYYSILGGAELNRFSTFMIKILLLSNDAIKVPTMRDVRALALMK